LHDLMSQVQVLEKNLLLKKFAVACSKDVEVTDIEEELVDVAGLQVEEPVVDQNRGIVIGGCGVSIGLIELDRAGALFTGCPERRDEGSYEVVVNCQRPRRCRGHVTRVVS
jgi:hypothetical protein